MNRLLLDCRFLLKDARTAGASGHMIAMITLIDYDVPLLASNSP